MKIKALLVEDEILGRETLRRMLEKYYFQKIEVVGAVGTAEEARVAIRTLRPDVVFLDISLPRENAFDLLDSLEVIDFAIVFVSAYERYALNALKVSPLDFLLKPVLPEELHEAIKKLEGYIRHRNRHR